MSDCKQCHLVRHVTVFPYYCVCGRVFGKGERYTPPAPPAQPGTALKSLISWFPVPGKTGCNACRSLEAKMNRWGPAKCREKREYIAKKLWVAAKRRKLPYSRRLVLILIDRAIANSEARP